MLDGDALMALGAEAEQALPYVTALMDRMKEGLLNNIMALDATQTGVFSARKSQMLGLEDILATVQADIRDGQNAIARIQGTPNVTNTGIL